MNAGGTAHRAATAALQLLRKPQSLGQKMQFGAIDGARDCFILIMTAHNVRSFNKYNCTTSICLLYSVHGWPDHMIDV